ncbi:hypothetical protein JHW43_003742 [Diplocarpon mali]|nr:hypothetical protein JHW43_003742 [Diplocarpon mali]
MILGELDAISLETGADTGSWKFEDYGQRLGSSDEEQIFRIAIQFGGGNAFEDLYTKNLQRPGRASLHRKSITESGP